MLEIKNRRHLPHFEIPGGTCHITWRLERGQLSLRPDERSCVLEVMRRGIEFDCRFLAAVVMDEHVHTLIIPGTKASSRRLASAWKSTSAHFLCKQFARRAPVWQRDYYQQWIKDPGHIPICIDYIKSNPQRKRPGIENYAWVLPWGAAADRRRAAL